MTFEEIIISKLPQNTTLTTTQIVELIYEQNPDVIERKRNQYIAQNKPKTEKELLTQINAEVAAYISRLNKKGLVTTNRTKGLNNSHTATPIANKINEEEPIEITHNNETTTTDCFGTVYLMKSQTFKNTYKIGITSDLDRRTKELRKDHRYGAFVLKPVASIDCQDYTNLERVLHKFFEDFRLSKGNDNNDVAVDTELFIDIDTIEEEFKLFCELIAKNPRFKNTNINQNLSETKVL